MKDESENEDEDEDEEEEEDERGAETQREGAQSTVNTGPTFGKLK